MLKTIHHRELDESQKSIGISSNSGKHVLTEKKTRDFTDAWKTNLLKQKKPNANGIQCYDPRLNKHVVTHMSKEYRQHIHVNAPKDDHSSGIEESKGQSKDTSFLSPISKVHKGKSLSNKDLLSETLNNVVKDGKGSYRYTESSRKAGPPRLRGVLDTNSSYGEALTPPTLSHAYSSPGDALENDQTSTSGVVDDLSEASNNNTRGGFGYIDTAVPEPLSPSALAQKLMRYKIGLSPAQKVRNMRNDMAHNKTQHFTDYARSMSRLNSRSGDQKVHERESEEEKKGPPGNKNSPSARGEGDNAGELLQNIGHWDESEYTPEPPVMRKRLPTNKNDKSNYSDNKTAQNDANMNLMRSLPLDENQIQQLSHEDFLHLREMLEQQEGAEVMIPINSMATGHTLETVSTNEGDFDSNRRGRQEPRGSKHRQQDVQDVLQQEASSPILGDVNTAAAGSYILGLDEDNINNDGFIYEDDDASAESAGVDVSRLNTAGTALSTGTALTNGSALSNRIMTGDTENTGGYVTKPKKGTKLNTALNSNNNQKITDSMSDLDTFFVNMHASQLSPSDDNQTGQRLSRGSKTINFRVEQFGGVATMSERSLNGRESLQLQYKQADNIPRSGDEHDHTHFKGGGDLEGDSWSRSDVEGGGLELYQQQGPAFNRSKGSYHSDDSDGTSRYYDQVPGDVNTPAGGATFITDVAGNNFLGPFPKQRGHRNVKQYKWWEQVEEYMSKTIPKKVIEKVAHTHAFPLPETNERQPPVPSNSSGNLSEGGPGCACHVCTKSGQLWCQTCQYVYCYNCWGTEDHHEPMDSSVLWAFDNQRLNGLTPNKAFAKVRKQIVIPPSQQLDKSNKHAVEGKTPPILLREDIWEHLQPAAKERAISSSKRQRENTKEELHLNLDEIPAVQEYDDMSDGIDTERTNLSKSLLDAAVEERQAVSSPLMSAHGSMVPSEPKETTMGMDPLDTGDAVTSEANVLTEPWLHSTTVEDSVVSKDSSLHVTVEHKLESAAITPIPLSPKVQTLSLNLPKTIPVDEHGYRILPGTEREREILRSRENGGLESRESAMTDRLTPGERTPGEYGRVSTPLYNNNRLTINPDHNQPGGANTAVLSPMVGTLTATASSDNLDVSPQKNNLQTAQLSKFNADVHYFKQVTSPPRLPGTTKQTRLRDNYVLFDDLNAIHFSKAKRDPEQVAYLQERHDDRLKITDERMRGYSERIIAQERRALHIAEEARKQVAENLESKQTMARRGPVITSEPKEDLQLKHVLKVGNFEASPLNKPLRIPHRNADGSLNRIPPNSNEIFKQQLEVEATLKAQGIAIPPSSQREVEKPGIVTIVPRKEQDAKIGENWVKPKAREVKPFGKIDPKTLFDEHSSRKEKEKRKGQNKVISTSDNQTLTDRGTATSVMDAGGSNTDDNDDISDYGDADDIYITAMDTSQSDADRVMTANTNGSARNNTPKRKGQKLLEKAKGLPPASQGRTFKRKVATPITSSRANTAGTATSALTNGTGLTINTAATADTTATGYATQGTDFPSARSGWSKDSDHDNGPSPTLPKGFSNLFATTMEVSQALDNTIDITSPSKTNKMTNVDSNRGTSGLRSISKQEYQARVAKISTPIKAWGWHRMRGKSSDSGNFPSLPFRGPPYIFDMKEQEFHDTVHKIYTPTQNTRDKLSPVSKETNKKLSLLTSLW